MSRGWFGLGERRQAAQVYFSGERGFGGGEPRDAWNRQRLLSGAEWKPRGCLQAGTTQSCSRLCLVHR